MRDEGGLLRRASQDPELLLDPTEVPMPGHGVRGDAVVDLGQVRLVGRCAPRARHAGLAIEVHRPVDQAGGSQRCDAEDRGRRVAAGIRHGARHPHVLTVQLGQAVRPATNPEIRAKVDDLGTQLEQVLAELA